MKRLVLMFVLLLSGIVSMAQGIQFDNSTFQESLAKAKSSGRLIFMDCYTSWCAPCKMMNSEVFSQKKVGDYFNANFVNVKFDMEKGEGVELAKKYEMKAFPTFLILNEKGDEIHRVVGGLDAEAFIKKISDGVVNSIFSMHNRFKAGETSKEFLLKYMEALGQAYEFKKLVPVMDQFTKKYMSTLTKEDWPIVRKYLSTPYCESFTYLLDHRAEMNTKFGEKEVGEKIYKTLQPVVFNTINSIVTDEKPFNKEEYQALKELVKKSGIEQQPYLEKALTYLSYHAQGDIIGCIQLFDDYFSKQPSDIRFSHTLFLNQTVFRKGNKQDIDMTVKSFKNVMKENNIPEADQMFSNIFKGLEKRRTEVPKRMYAKSFEGEKSPEFYVAEWISKEPKMKGKFIVMEFWATWCGPCMMSIPKLNKIHDTFKKEVIVVGISDESREKIIGLKYAPEPIRYYSATDPKRVMNKTFKITGIPHAVIVNPDGIVVWDGFPLLEDDELDVPLIARLIKEYQQSKKDGKAKVQK